MCLLTHYCSLSKFDGDVARPALIPIGPAHRGGTNPLQPRTFVDEARLDEQIVDIDVFRLLRRVGNGRLDDLLDLAGGFSCS